MVDGNCKYLLKYNMCSAEPFKKQKCDFNNYNECPKYKIRKSAEEERDAELLSSRIEQTQEGVFELLVLKEMKKSGRLE